MAYRLSQDPFLAMHAGQQVEMGGFRIIDYLLMNAATPGHALARMCRVFGLINTWIHWEISDLTDAKCLRLLGAMPTLPPPAVEFTWTVLVNRMRYLISADWSPQLIRFSYPEPSDSTPHKDYFRCEIEYGTAAEMVISQGDWDFPIADSDHQLFQIIDEHARLLMAQRVMPDDLVGRICATIARALDGGDFKLETIASYLNISGRTLRRRLDDVGVVYSDLVEQVREQLAMERLADKRLSLTEVALMLGFSEQSAFNRAFKRWKGVTPRAYRHQLLNQKLGKP